VGKSRLGQVWAARQYAKSRPWQRAREAKRLREAEIEARRAREGATHPEESGYSEDSEKEKEESA
jgi:hypothetical protein